MPDLEKVITALQHCIDKPCHTNCPYFSSDDPTQAYCLFNRIMPDALALLKEQEARVMTREEVIRSQDWIWYEWKNTHCGWTIAVNCDEKWIEWEDSTTDPLCKYGKIWRCWTSRPSEQQMRDTKWEGEKDE